MLVFDTLQDAERESRRSVMVNKVFSDSSCSGRLFKAVLVLCAVENNGTLKEQGIV